VSEDLTGTADPGFCPAAAGFPDFDGFGFAIVAIALAVVVGAFVLSDWVAERWG